MFTWAKLALTLAQLFSMFMTWLRERQLINQGEELAVAAVLKDQAEAIELAQKTRRETADALARDDTSIMRHDKYERRGPKGS